MGLRWIRRIGSGSFTKIIGSFQDLCRMVDFYSRSVRSGHSLAEAQSALAKLPEVSQGFAQSVNHLYTYLQSSRLQDANKAPHLRQLYMRLNFNGFVGGGMTQSVLQA